MLLVVGLAKPKLTGRVEGMTYAGLFYYEEKQDEDLVTFTAAKDLNILLEVYSYFFRIVAKVRSNYK